MNGKEKFVCTICFTKNPKLSLEFNQVHLNENEQPKEAQTKVVEVDIHEEIILIETEEITIDILDSNNKDGPVKNTLDGFWNLEENCEEETTILNFSCDQCEDKFCNQDELNGHTEVSHMKIDFLCKNCIFSTQSKGLLEEHIKSLSDK